MSLQATAYPGPTSLKESFYSAVYHLNVHGSGDKLQQTSGALTMLNRS